MEPEQRIGTFREARRNIRKRMFTYIGGGLGLVIGLAWNEAIAALIKSVFPNETHTIVAKFIYAFILTVVVGLALFYIEKALSRGEKE